jgi:hypothetical protein
MALQPHRHGLPRMPAAHQWCRGSSYFHTTVPEPQHARGPRTSAPPQPGVVSAPATAAARKGRAKVGYLGAQAALSATRSRVRTGAPAYQAMSVQRASHCPSVLSLSCPRRLPSDSRFDFFILQSNTGRPSWPQQRGYPCSRQGRRARGKGRNCHRMPYGLPATPTQPKHYRNSTETLPFRVSVRRPHLLEVRRSLEMISQ